MPGLETRRIRRRTEPDSALNPRAFRFLRQKLRSLRSFLWPERFLENAGIQRSWTDGILRSPFPFRRPGKNSVIRYFFNRWNHFLNHSTMKNLILTSPLSPPSGVISGPDSSFFPGFHLFFPPFLPGPESSFPPRLHPGQLLKWKNPGNKGAEIRHTTSYPLFLPQW